MFEDCTAQLDLLIHAFQPTSSSNSYRNQVSKFIESTIQSRLQQTQIVGSGSYTSRTYLPESDIDLVLIPRNSNEIEGKKDDEQESHEQVVNVTDSSQEMLSISTIIQSLCDAVTQRDAAKSAAHSTGPRGRGGSLGSFTIPSMPYSNMNIRNIEFINARTKVSHCVVNNLGVDVTINSIGALLTVLFIEESDRYIGKGHLFKRSILLIKAWALHESASYTGGHPVLGSKEGMLSSYAISILVLHLFNIYPQLEHPLAVVIAFFATYAEFQWENHILTVEGPIPITPDMTPSENAHLGHNNTIHNSSGGNSGEVDKLKCLQYEQMYPQVQSKLRPFLLEFRNKVRQYTSQNNGIGEKDQVTMGNSQEKDSSANISSAYKTYCSKLPRRFSIRCCNIQDPVDLNNNLGLSVLPENLQIIRNAFSQSLLHLQRVCNIYVQKDHHQVMQHGVISTHVNKSPLDLMHMANGNGNHKNHTRSGSDSDLSFIRTAFPYIYRTYIGNSGMRSDLCEHPMQLWRSQKEMERQRFSIGNNHNNYTPPGMILGMGSVGDGYGMASYNREDRSYIVSLRESYDKSLESMVGGDGDVLQGAREDMWEGLRLSTLEYTQHTPQSSSIAADNEKEKEKETEKESSTSPATPAPLIVDTVSHDNDADSLPSPTLSGPTSPTLSGVGSPSGSTDASSPEGGGKKASPRAGNTFYALASPPMGGNGSAFFDPETFIEPAEKEEKDEKNGNSPGQSKSRSKRRKNRSASHASPLTVSTALENEKEVNTTAGGTSPGKSNSNQPSSILMLMLAVFGSGMIFAFFTAVLLVSPSTGDNTIIGYAKIVQSYFFGSSIHHPTLTDAYGPGSHGGDSTLYANQPNNIKDSGLYVFENHASSSRPYGDMTYWVANGTSITLGAGSSSCPYRSIKVGMHDLRDIAPPNPTSAEGPGGVNPGGAVLDMIGYKDDGCPILSQQPAYEWYKDGVPFQGPRQHTLGGADGENARGSPFLQLDEVSHAQEGLYTCYLYFPVTAPNQLVGANSAGGKELGGEVIIQGDGSISTSASERDVSNTEKKMKISAASHTDLSSFIAEHNRKAKRIEVFSGRVRVAVPPNVLSHRQQLDAKHGDSIELKILYTAEPPPVFTWYHTGNELTEIKGDTLTVDSLTIDHSGTYTCVLTNIAGSSVFEEYYLHVEVPPDQREKTRTVPSKPMSPTRREKHRSTGTGQSRGQTAGGEKMVGQGRSNNHVRKQTPVKPSQVTPKRKAPPTTPKTTAAPQRTARGL